MLRFQQIVPSQSPTNHPICFTLIYQLFKTKKKIYVAEFSAYMLNYSIVIFIGNLVLENVPNGKLNIYKKN